MPVGSSENPLEGIVHLTMGYFSFKGKKNDRLTGLLMKGPGPWQIFVPVPLV